MLNRIYGIFLRYHYATIRSWDRLTDFIYWPIIDLSLWGITGAYIEASSNGGIQVLDSLVCGIILWYSVYRTQGDTSIGVLEELWNKNLINIFSSPVSIFEYRIGLLSYNLIKLILATLMASLIAYILFGFNFFKLGWIIIPFMFLLALFGWTLGIFVAGLLFRFSTKIQSIAWTIIWIFAPFSLVYFPREILPNWGQTLSLLVPTSYVFEEMRSVLHGDRIIWHNLLICLELNLVYLALSALFFRSSFRAALNKGLVKIF
jgi:ABC-2 type transport system permease protein